MALRFELPVHKRLVHELKIDVRWGDMDAMGHVNNTVYLRYFEMVRIDWLKNAGGIFDERGCGPVIVNAFLNFIRPVEYPGELLARHYVGEAGRTSVDTFLTLERADQPGVVWAEGGARLVWTDFKVGKAVPLPEWMRRQLG